MKRNFSSILLVVLLATTLAGCGVIGGIIKGAFWLGVIVVVIVILLIWWIVSKFRGPRT